MALWFKDTALEGTFNDTQSGAGIEVMLGLAGMPRCIPDYADPYSVSISDTPLHKLHLFHSLSCGIIQRQAAEAECHYRFAYVR